MTGEDDLTQSRWLRVRLREKGGKRHAMACHHKLEKYLAAYLDRGGPRNDQQGPLFRTIGRGTCKLTRTVLPQANGLRDERPRAAGIATKLGNQQFPGDGDRGLSQGRRHA
jgi:hypothetical protein